jgi:Tfp pilus assembly protein PilW
LGSEACSLAVEKLRMGHADRAVEAEVAGHRHQTAAAMVAGLRAHTQRVQARMLEFGQRPE